MDLCLSREGRHVGRREGEAILRQPFPREQQQHTLSLAPVPATITNNNNSITTATATYQYRSGALLAPDITTALPLLPLTLNKSWAPAPNAGYRLGHAMCLLYGHGYNAITAPFLLQGKKRETENWKSSWWNHQERQMGLREEARHAGLYLWRWDHCLNVFIGYVCFLKMEKNPIFYWLKQSGWTIPY